LIEAPAYTVSDTCDLAIRAASRLILDPFRMDFKRFDRLVISLKLPIARMCLAEEITTEF